MKQNKKLYESNKGDERNFYLDHIKNQQKKIKSHLKMMKSYKNYMKSEIQ